MTLQGKIWGNTREIFNKNNVEIHRVDIKPGGYCSKHKHTAKFNMFLIETGELVVRIWKNDYDLVDSTYLLKGEQTVVKPGEYHQFEAQTHVVAYEIYWTELDQSDIVRESVGGELEDK